MTGIANGQLTRPLASSGMSLVVRLLSVLLLAGALVTPRLRWRRAAFVGFVALGLASFALRAGWPAKPLAPQACEGVVGSALAVHSFRNTPHILLFAVCFLIARAQFRWTGADGRSSQRAGAGAFGITMVIGALLELAQGATGAGHCRLRDLLPDAAGALLGWAMVLASTAAWVRWRPGQPPRADRA
jgi:hypothetical protein